jgi:hypothetical protein
MRELTIPEFDQELAEELPARELMGSAGTMAASRAPVMTWHDGSHYYWQDVGPQYSYRR